MGGLNNGTIQNCYVMGDVTGRESIGCLVGSSTGSPILGCFAVGSATGDQVGISESVGGIAGATNSRIADCYTAVTVNSQNRFAGGIVGSIDSTSGIVENCYATGSVTARTIYGS